METHRAALLSFAAQLHAALTHCHRFLHACKSQWLDDSQRSRLRTRVTDSFETRLILKSRWHGYVHQIASRRKPETASESESRHTQRSESRLCVCADSAGVRLQRTVFKSTTEPFGFTILYILGFAESDFCFPKTNKNKKEQHFHLKMIKTKSKNSRNSGNYQFDAENILMWAPGLHVWPPRLHFSCKSVHKFLSSCWKLSETVTRRSS